MTWAHGQSQKRKTCLWAFQKANFNCGKHPRCLGRPRFYCLLPIAWLNSSVQPCKSGTIVHNEKYIPFFVIVDNHAREPLEILRFERVSSPSGFRFHVNPPPITETNLPANVCPRWGCWRSHRLTRLWAWLGIFSDGIWVCLLYT